MANYNIVVDTSSFKPMDFNMGMKVLDEGRDAYKEEMSNLLKIAEDNGDLDIPEGTMVGDRDISLELKQLRNERDLIANDISTEFNAENRLRALKFYINYKSKMKPIKDMVSAYNDEVSKINTMLMQDPSTIILNPPKLGDYYGGIKKSKIMLTSGNAIAKDINTALSAALESKAGEMHISKTEIEGIIKTWLSAGISAELMYELASNPQYANTLTKEQREIGLLIGKVIEDIKQSYGYYSISDPTLKRKFDSYLRIGAMASLPKADLKLQSDPEPDLALRRLANSLAQALSDYLKSRDALLDDSFTPENRDTETLYVATGSSLNTNLYRKRQVEGVEKSITVYESTDGKYASNGQGTVSPGSQPWDLARMDAIEKNSIKIPIRTTNGLRSPSNPQPLHYDYQTGNVTYSDGVIYNVRTKKWSLPSSGNTKREDSPKEEPKPSEKAPAKLAPAKKEESKDAKKGDAKKGKGAPVSKKPTENSPVKKEPVVKKGDIQIPESNKGYQRARL